MYAISKIESVVVGLLVAVAMPFSIPTTARAQTPAASGYHANAESGIVWRRCDLGTVMSAQTNRCTGVAATLNWVDAITLVEQLNAKTFEGFSDWRLITGDDLRVLLLEVPEIRASSDPVTRGSASAFGGYHLNIKLSLCDAANKKIQEVFGSVNDIGSDFIGSHRWMADNTDRKAWQKPLSLNLINSYGINSLGYCNVLTYAFLEDQFDSKRDGQIRPHGDQRIFVVRGGDGGKFWEQAKAAVAHRGVILGESEAQGRAAMARVVGNLNAIKNVIRDALAAGAGSPSSLGGGSSDSANKPVATVEARGGVKSISEFGKINQPRNPFGYEVVCTSGRKEMLFRGAYSDNGDWFYTSAITNTFVGKGSLSLHDAATALCKR